MENKIIYVKTFISSVIPIICLFLAYAFISHGGTVTISVLKFMLLIGVYEAVQYILNDVLGC